MESLPEILRSFGIAQERPQFLRGEQVRKIARELKLSVRQTLIKLLGQDIWPERFRRNYSIISASAQAKLLSLRLFIAGCGGLGGELASLLVRMGAGVFCICDPDIFEESNLNRQRFCTEKTLGLPKAEVVRAGLLEIASWIEVKALTQSVTPETLPDLLCDKDVVIDCLDSVARKKMLEQAAANAGLPYLHGSVLGQDGFVYLDIPGQSKLDQLYPDIAADNRSLGANPVLVTTVTGTATYMACALLKRLILDSGSQPMQHLDFSVPELEIFSF